jgi:hypothetical protein
MKPILVQGYSRCVDLKLGGFSINGATIIVSALIGVAPDMFAKAI